MWVKVWTIGNGGIPSDYGHHEIYDYGDDDESQEEIAYDLKCIIGPLSNGVRSINWDKVDILPDEVIEEKIKDANSTIAHAKKTIIELEAMREVKDGEGTTDS